MKRALNDHCSKIGNADQMTRRTNVQVEDGLQVIELVLLVYRFTAFLIQEMDSRVS